MPASEPLEDDNDGDFGGIRRAGKLLADDQKKEDVIENKEWHHEKGRKHWRDSRE